MNVIVTPPVEQTATITMTLQEVKDVGFLAGSLSSDEIRAVTPGMSAGDQDRIIEANAVLYEAVRGMRVSRRAELEAERERYEKSHPVGSL